LGVIVVTVFWVDVPMPQNMVWVLVFAVLSCGVMATFGFMAGIYSEKFDHLAGFQNFVIMPMSFLSGVFYSIHSLPPLWHALSKINPIFYMIDGFRFGFFGVSDVSPWLSFAVIMVVWLVLTVFSLYWLRTGYKLRQAR
jgi:ABC-2 type transport system permease protein